MPVAIVKPPRSMNRKRVAIQPESKKYDIIPTDYGVNTTPVIVSIFNPIRGDDYDERNGRIARPTYLEINGVITLDQARNPGVNDGGSAEQQARFLILWDREPNTALPAITAILDVNDPLSMFNLDNRARFSVVVDRLWTLGPILVNSTATQAVAAYSNTGYRFRIKKKLSKKVTFGSNNTGTITDIEANSLLMVWVGSRGASNFDAIATVATRVRYYDS